MKTVFVRPTNICSESKFFAFLFVWIGKLHKHPDSVPIYEAKYHGSASWLRSLCNNRQKWSGGRHVKSVSLNFLSVMVLQQSSQCCSTDCTEILVKESKGTVTDFARH